LLSDWKKMLDQIVDTITPVLDELGIDLVEAQLHGSSGRTILRVYVDVPGGISLAQCTAASRRISDILDRKDLMKDRYVLEVSSPGTDRPLRTESDFSRHIGRDVALKVQSEGDVREWRGKITSASDDGVHITSDAGTCSFPLDDIIDARIVVDIR
jgi:ribosome maturation factor RimP